MQSLFCNKSDQKKFDENLKKWFANTYEHSNRDFIKTILLFWNSVYPYEYMDDWQKLNQTSLPQKEHFYSRLK